MKVGVLIAWWFVILLLGWAVFCILRPLFKNLYDQGYNLTKILGLLLVCYPTWIISHISFIPYSAWLCQGIAIVILICGIISYYRYKYEITIFIKDKFRLILVSELLFMFLLVLSTVVGSSFPYYCSAENMCDFAFISGIHCSEHMPPQDPWYTGEPINYYYFGHFCISTMCKLMCRDLDEGVNIAFIFWYALLCQGAFAVACDLLKSAWLGLFAPLFVGWMGNLHGFLQLLFLDREDFNWLKASRIIGKSIQIASEVVNIDYTITEFPYFTFLLHQFHAHFLSTPMLVLGLGFLLAVIKLDLNRKYLFKRVAALVVISAIIYGAQPVMNFWELPTVIFIMSGILFLGLLKNNKVCDKNNDIQRTIKNGTSTKHRCHKLLFSVISLSAIVFAFLLYIPFYLNFNDGENSLGLLPANQRSEFVKFLMVNGIFILISVIYIIHKILLLSHTKRYQVIVGLLFGFFLPYVFLGSLAVGLTLSLIIGHTLILMNSSTNARAMVANFLALVAYSMILGCEFIYVDDGFFTGHHVRVNTVFKFYFQVWIILGIVCAYFIGTYLSYLSEKGLKFRQLPVLLLSAIFIVGGVSYTYYGYLDRFREENNQYTLNGMLYVKNIFPDDYAAIKFIQRHVPPTALILEAPGITATYSGRMSAYTGRPTIIGWLNGHQELWRIATKEAVQDRWNRAENAYRSTSLKIFNDLVKDFDVDYVYIGKVEIERYTVQGLAKFVDVGTPVFISNDHVLIKVDKDRQ